MSLLQQGAPGRKSSSFGHGRSLSLFAMESSASNGICAFTGNYIDELKIGPDSTNGWKVDWGHLAFCQLEGRACQKVFGWGYRQAA